MNQRSLYIIFTILVMALTVAACNTAYAGTTTAPVAQIPEFTITAVEYGFEVPAKIEAGVVALTLTNEGQEPHHAQLARLNSGVTSEQFQTTLKEDPDAAMPMLTFVGGPGALDPGLRQQVTLELIPGQYVWLDFIPSPADGVPHLAKGMIAPMEVVAPGTNDRAGTFRPTPIGTVTMLDFAFTLPANIKAGKQVWAIANNGEEPHEINLVKLPQGKTIVDVQAFMHTPSGPPPFTGIGGFQAISPGEIGWLNLDLEPGEYVALCHVPDQNGTPHTEHGMLRAFSVN